MMQESTDLRNNILEKLIDPNDNIEPIIRILSYCDEIQEEYNEYIQVLLNADIWISWEMPLYQTVFRSVVKPPPMEQLSQFADDLRVDRITTDESQLIIKNWNEFCEYYKLPNKPECFAQWKNKNKKFISSSSPKETLRYSITAHLAKNLNRTLHQVYMHFVSKYGYKAYGAYSSVEEKIMEICFNYDQSNAVFILKTILQREPRALYKRMIIHFNGKVQEVVPKVNWNIDLVEIYLKKLIKLCDCNNLSELCDSEITKNVWVALSENLNIPYVRLRNLWYRKLHIQLFANHPIYLRKVRLKVIKILRESHLKFWRDINWNHVRSKFPMGYTTTFLYYYTVMTAYKCVRGFTKVPLTNLLNEMETKSLNYQEKCLKRLRFNEDGALEFVD